MSDENDKPNGGGKVHAIGDGKELTEADVERMVLEQMLGEITNFMSLLLGDSVPPAVILGAAQRALAEQKSIGDRIVKDVVDPRARANANRWGVNIRGGSGGKAMGQIVVAKDPAELGDIHAVAQYSHLLGLALAPQARAVLYALGFNLEWFQMKAKSPIIVP